MPIRIVSNSTLTVRTKLVAYFINFFQAICECHNARSSAMFQTEDVPHFVNTNFGDQAKIVLQTTNRYDTSFIPKNLERPYDDYSTLLFC